MHSHKINVRSRRGQYKCALKILAHRNLCERVRMYVFVFVCMCVNACVHVCISTTLAEGSTLQNKFGIHNMLN